MRIGFPSWDDIKYLCKTKLTCYLHTGARTAHLMERLSSLPCPSQASHSARQNARNGQMLPRLVFGLCQGQVVGEEEGEGRPCLVSKEEEEAQTEQPRKIFYVQAWLICNSAWSPPPSLISSYTRKGCWAIGSGHCFRSGARLTFLCSILGLPACRHLVGITMSGKRGCSLCSALRMLC